VIEPIWVAQPLGEQPQALCAPTRGLEPRTLSLRVSRIKGTSALLSHMSLAQMLSDHLRCAEFGTKFGLAAGRPYHP